MATHIGQAKAISKAKAKNGASKAPPIPPVMPDTGKPKHAPPPVVAGTKQTEIPGTERPKPPKEVAKAAEALRSAFNAEKRARKATTEKRAALEKLMLDHQVPELLIEDDEGDQVRIWVDTKTKVKMAVVEDEN